MGCDFVGQLRHLYRAMLTCITLLRPTSLPSVHPPTDRDWPAVQTGLMLCDSVFHFTMAGLSESMCSVVTVQSIVVDKN